MANSSMMQGSAPMGNPDGFGSDEEMDGHLQRLLADLSDEDVAEIGALAEAMHAEGQS